MFVFVKSRSLLRRKKNFPFGFLRVIGYTPVSYALREFDIANYSRYVGNEDIRLIDARTIAET